RPGAARQSLACRLDGATGGEVVVGAPVVVGVVVAGSVLVVLVVDVVVTLVGEEVVVEVVVTGAEAVSSSACSGPLTAPWAGACRASLMARASCTTHPEPAGISVFRSVITPSAKMKALRAPSSSATQPTTSPAPSMP